MFCCHFMSTRMINGFVGPLSHFPNKNSTTYAQTVFYHLKILRKCAPHTVYPAVCTWSCITLLMSWKPLFVLDYNVCLHCTRCIVFLHFIMIMSVYCCRYCHLHIFNKVSLEITSVVFQGWNALCWMSR